MYSRNLIFLQNSHSWCGLVSSYEIVRPIFARFSRDGTRLHEIWQVLVGSRWGLLHAFNTTHSDPQHTPNTHPTHPSNVCNPVRLHSVTWGPHRASHRVNLPCARPVVQRYSNVNIPKGVSWNIYNISDNMNVIVEYLWQGFSILTQAKYSDKIYIHVKDIPHIRRSNWNLDKVVMGSDGGVHVAHVVTCISCCQRYSNTEYSYKITFMSKIFQCIPGISYSYKIHILSWCQT